MRVKGQVRTSLKLLDGSKSVMKSSVDMRPAMRTGLSAKYVVLSLTPVSVNVPSFRVAPDAVCTKRESAAWMLETKAQIPYASAASIATIIFRFSPVFILPFPLYIYILSIFLSVSSAVLCVDRRGNILSRSRNQENNDDEHE